LSSGVFFKASFQREFTSSRLASGKTMSNTSLYQSTAWPSIPSLMFCHLCQDKNRNRRDGESKLTSGSSHQSPQLSLGNKILEQPALRAATVFSLNPPIRSTLPVTVNSPVIANAGSTCLFMARLRRDVAIVIPADGPSFWTAPSGQWRWILA
jgi:hypothetical protein